MGLVYADICLKNLTEPQLSQVETKSLVDTGALHLCIPEHVAIQLGYDCANSDKREVTIASGESLLCPYVGPLEISYGNRRCFSGALVLGNEVLLGAIPMEDMDLTVNPARLKLEPNPENPNIPASTVK
jgi:clan AA aspartic protease